MITTKKVAVKYGNYTDVYIFERPIRRMNLCDPEEPRIRATSSPRDQADVIASSARRSKRQLFRLIMGNLPADTKPVFLTLTSHHELPDEELIKSFRLFIRRLSTHLFASTKGLRYVCVPERQKRGVLHFHLVIFNCPFIPSDTIATLWGMGFIKINTIDASKNGLENAVAYLTKYMSKEVQTRGTNTKRYFSSRGLEQPSKTTVETDVDKLLDEFKLLGIKPYYWYETSPQKKHTQFFNSFVMLRYRRHIL